MIRICSNIPLYNIIAGLFLLGSVMAYSFLQVRKRAARFDEMNTESDHNARLMIVLTMVGVVCLLAFILYAFFSWGPC